jgi:hypothetical protein
VCVGEPAADWDGVLRVENVRRWGIVDDDRVLQVSANLRQVLQKLARVVLKNAYYVVAYLHVVALMVVTTFAE